MKRECVRLASDGNERGLGITCCTSGEKVAVWFRRSVALYFSGDLSQPPSIVRTCFNIQQVVISQHVGVCLDITGNIYTFPLEGTGSLKKMEQQSKEHDILHVQFMDGAEEILLCLNHYLDFTLVKFPQLHTYLNFRLDIPEKYSTIIKENIILKVWTESLDTRSLKMLLKCERDVYGTLSVLCGDKRSIWAFCLSRNEQMGKITPSLLYVSPVDVTEVQVCDGPCVLLALQSGTIIVLNESYTKVVHVNASVYRMFAISNDKVVYTDGMDLWCAENFSSERDLIFNKLFVKHVRDLTVIKKMILCITFSNLLYSFSIEEGDTKPGFANDVFTHLPEKLTEASDIVTELNKIANDNNEILKKIKIEKTLMLAVALSRCNTMLCDHIKINAKIVTEFDEEMRDPDIVRSHFGVSSYMVLLTLRTSASIRHHLADVCTGLNGTFQMHVCVRSPIPTITAITLAPSHLDRFLFALPINTEKTQLQIDIDIVGRVPVPHGQRRDFWTVLFSTSVQLDAEHFICTEDRAIAGASRKCESDVILKIANLHHGAFLQFQLPKPTTPLEEWTCFVDLAENFRDKLRQEELYGETIDSRTRKYLAKALGATEFARGHLVQLRVGASSVTLRIEREPGTMALRVDGPPHVAWRLRQLIARVLSAQPSLRVPHAQYARLEGLQRELRAIEGADALEIARHFHKYTLSALPL